MRIATLDLGTNTCLLLIAEVRNGQIVQVLHDEVRVVRLGQGVNETKRLHPEALQRAEEAFKGFAETIAKFKVEKTLACATSATRDSSNGDELVRLGAKYSIPIETISGEREAELTFLGTMKESWKGPVVIIDVGGGSTEYILGDETGLIARKSLDIGAVRLTEKFVTGHPIEPIEIARITGAIQDATRELKKIFPISDETRAIAVAGTPTTLAAVDMEMPFSHERVDGYLLPEGKIRHWAHRLFQMSIEERQALVGMEPKRADVIVAGALILSISCQALGLPSLEVSVRGLRYGIARRIAREAATC